MDHVPVLPQVASVAQTRSQHAPPAGRATMPPAGMDAGQLAAALMARCPGSLVWFGARTRRWWAFVKLNEAWTLLEAPTLEEIAWPIMGHHGGTL
jgi:hypothetical protein